ncbi:MAG: FecR domain-containing protein [Planctomycetes bacterium]|nr:FecR domain-containing protein [Planctomycetota bacterium]
MLKKPDCAFVRSNLYLYRAGEMGEEESVALGAHLAGCPECMGEARADQSSLSLLNVIDEIIPNPDIWNRIAIEVERDASAVRPRRQGRVLSLSLRVAAAASILAAVFSFIFVAQTGDADAATVAYAAPGTDIAPGRQVRSGELFMAPGYVVLALPDVGTLKLNRGTEITFDGPRHVRLAKGELFAEIIPSGRGFAVESGDATVKVLGTRFGVKSAQSSPSTVYVVEGTVEVEAAFGRLSLSGRQMATVGRPTTSLKDEALLWIAAYETPSLALTAFAAEAGAVSRGDPVDLHVAFRTNSPAPVLLPPLDDLLQQLQVRVTDPSGKSYLARPAAVVKEDFQTRGPGGPIRFDVSTRCGMVLRVDAALFPGAGPYSLSVGYQPSAVVRTSDWWNRSVESDSFQIEVR